MNGRMALREALRFDCEYRCNCAAVAADDDVNDDDDDDGEEDELSRTLESPTGITLTQDNCNLQDGELSLLDNWTCNWCPVWESECEIRNEQVWSCIKGEERKEREKRERWRKKQVSESGTWGHEQVNKWTWYRVWKQCCYDLDTLILSLSFFLE